MDPETRKKNIATVTEGLALAEAVGARCCVDIAGSFSPTSWFGPHPENLSERFFDAAVGNARSILDAVKPTRTTFCYEMMAWSLPDSPDACLRMLEAVDRKAFAVHLDPCNRVHSPARYYGSSDLVRECYAKLGPHVASVHAKDLTWDVEMAVHFREVRAGLGSVDHGAWLAEHARHAPVGGAGLLPSSFDLIYNSLDTKATFLGSGWTHSYGMKIVPKGQDFVLDQGYGSSLKLTRRVGDVWKPLFEPYPILLRNPDSSSRLIDRENVSYLFDPTGRLTAIQDLNGNTLTFTYNEAGNLTGIIDPTGRTATFTYNDQSRITSITDFNGNVHSFTYNGVLLTDVSTLTRSQCTRHPACLASWCAG